MCGLEQSGLLSLSFSLLFLRERNLNAYSLTVEWHIQVQEKYLNNQILICYFQNAFQQKQDRLILIGLTFLFDYLSAKIQCSWSFKWVWTLSFALLSFIPSRRKSLLQTPYQYTAKALRNFIFLSHPHILYVTIYLLFSQMLTKR